MTLKIKLADLRDDLDCLISREKFNFEDHKVYYKSKSNLVSQLATIVSDLMAKFQSKLLMMTYKEKTESLLILEEQSEINLTLLDKSTRPIQAEVLG